MAMRIVVLALLMAMCAPVAAAVNAPPAEPDFAWGAGCSAEVNASLGQAKGKWQEASEMPTSPEWLRSKKNTSFDDRYLRELIGRQDQGAVAYSLLDMAVRKQKALDECKALHARAVSGAAGAAPESTKRFDDSYYLLRSRIKLATGLARASIARQMTDPSSSGYCFQAMEAAIDALRDSADDAQKVPGGLKRAETIRKLRSTLFEAWEQAQRSKDTDLIGEVDLPLAMDESGLAGDNQALERL